MKNLKILGASSVLAVSVLFAGCGASTPSCDGKDTKSVLNDIIKEQLGSNTITTYSSFMTENVDEKSKKVTCKAEATLITTQGNKTEKVTEWINYTVRYTDKGDQIYVELLD